jgi:hypothetical protein
LPPSPRAAPTARCSRSRIRWPAASPTSTICCRISGLYIVGEHFLRIRHHLLAPKGARIDRLKRVYSHIQGLSQCRKLIRDLGLEAIVRANTAGAAKEIAERNDIEEAVIASEIAGEIYGLQSLRANVEDQLGNTTRFVVMARNRSDPDPKAGPTLTAILFQVRSQPAALYKALGGFATNGINVVKLESYITDASFQVAQFLPGDRGAPGRQGGRPCARRAQVLFRPLQDAGRVSRPSLSRRPGLTAMTASLADPADLLAFQGVPGAYSQSGLPRGLPRLDPAPLRHLCRCLRGVAGTVSSTGR